VVSSVKDWLEVSTEFSFVRQRINQPSRSWVRHRRSLGPQIFPARASRYCELGRSRSGNEMRYLGGEERRPIGRAPAHPGVLTGPEYFLTFYALPPLRACQVRSSRTIHRSTRSKITPVAAAPQPLGWVTNKNPALTMPSKDSTIKSQEPALRRGVPLDCACRWVESEVGIFLRTSAVNVEPDWSPDVPCAYMRMRGRNRRSVARRTNARRVKSRGFEFCPPIEIHSRWIPIARALRVFSGSARAAR
jgi:hypothetical protein